MPRVYVKKHLYTNSHRLVGKAVGKVNRPYIPRTRKHLSCGMSLKIFYKKEGWRPSSKHYAYGFCPQFEQNCPCNTELQFLQIFLIIIIIVILVYVGLIWVIYSMDLVNPQ